jgi:predicted Zn-dependent protease
MARSGLSNVYVTMGELDKGEAELEALLAKDPDDPGVNNDLGYLYADRGKHLEKAEAMVRKALEEEPDNGAYLDSLGWVLFKRGKLKEAVEPLEKAVRELGTDATLYDHLGDVYFGLREYRRAQTAWEQAAALGAKSVPPDKRLPEIRKKLEALKALGPPPPTASDENP